MADTLVSDIIVPRVFTNYLSQRTAAQYALVQSGALSRDPRVDGFIAKAGGRQVDMPSWQPLGTADADVATDTVGSLSTVRSISTSQEVGVRLSRSVPFGAADLTAALAGEDPIVEIVRQTSTYWLGELQRAVLATLAGVFADNAANDSGDYTSDISAVFSAGVTDVSVTALNNAMGTAGDARGMFKTVVMHSTVYAKLLDKNRIDFISDTSNTAGTSFGSVLGMKVVVDDGVPVSSQDYTTYLLGDGALKWGVGQPKKPVEEDRIMLAGNGGGFSRVVTRTEWVIHPTGHAYDGTLADGGPSNAATANNLGNAGSWDRVYPQRKQIALASLITTEAA